MSHDPKETNPKHALGVAKVPFHLFPTQVLAEACVGMLEGALKYGAHNYRVSGARASTYLNAIARHLMDFAEGQDTDPVSLLCHLTKIISSAAVLRDCMLQGNWTDDRPPRAANPHWLEDLNAKVKTLLAKYPNSPEPATEVGQSLLRAAAAAEARDNAAGSAIAEAVVQWYADGIRKGEYEHDAPPTESKWCGKPAPWPDHTCAMPKGHDGHCATWTASASRQVWHSWDANGAPVDEFHEVAEHARSCYEADVAAEEAAAAKTVARPITTIEVGTTYEGESFVLRKGPDFHKQGDFE
jgi:hypothetical protein